MADSIAAVADTNEKNKKFIQENEHRGERKTG